MKYVFSAKIWFLKFSTRIVKYEPGVIKLNPAKQSLVIQTANIIICQTQYLSQNKKFLKY